MANLRESRAWQSFTFAAQWVLLLWVIHFVQWALHMRWAFMGILPRDLDGLKGILFAPLIHADWGHLISNTPPLFFLSLMIMYFYRRVAYATFAMIYLLTGAAVWLFARNSFHIGASGVIYGLVAFVFWSGIFRRNIRAIALALIVVFYYGSMVMGILPGQDGISWESHLLGGLAGIFVAYWFKEDIEKDESKPVYSWEDEASAPPSSFLDPDTFEKTKADRLREQRNQDWTGW